MKTFAVFGATSAIAQETARMAAEAGAAVFLVGRDAARLGAIAQDLEVRGAKQVAWHAADLRDPAAQEAAVAAAYDCLGKTDTVLIAHGTLPDQEAAERDAGVAIDALTVNMLSPIGILLRLAPRLEAQGGGCVGVCSSVAGDRGRRSNYVYGSAKGGLDRFLEGFRARLLRSGVRVVTVKPGFVDTPMTAHLAKNPLFASPRRVGRRIWRVLQRPRAVVYVPGYWRWIMGVLRIVPEPIFRRLPL